MNSVVSGEASRQIPSTGQLHNDALGAASLFLPVLHDKKQISHLFGSMLSHSVPWSILTVQSGVLGEPSAEMISQKVQRIQGAF